MIIEVSDGLRIETEGEHGWVLKARRVAESGKSAGETRWEPFGYYSTLEAACRGCLEIRAARSSSVHRGLDAAISELRTLWREIREAAGAD